MTGSYLFKGGRVVLPEGCFDADVRVRGKCLREFGSDLKPMRGEIVVDACGHIMYPGLINSHDHLEFNLYPRLGVPPYNNAYEWGHDLQKRWSSTIQAIQRIPLRYRLRWGAWKNLFSGVTRVVHHNPYSWHFRVRFPIEVHRQYRFAHSLQFEQNVRSILRRRRNNTPFVIHLAEGKDAAAEREVRLLAELHALNEWTVAVHAVGITKKDIELLQRSKASVVWCPASNMFLFGKTAPIDELTGKIRVALGTDSSLTGSTTLFEELRMAKQLSSLTPQSLFSLVTEAPRSIFHLSPDAGTLQEGGTADLFLLPAWTRDPYDNLLNVNPASINLMMRKGQIVFFDPHLLKNSSLNNSQSVVCLNGQKKILHNGSLQKLFNHIQPFLKHYSYLQ